MHTAQQIPLDFPVRPAMGREDFVLGPSNQDAVDWVDRWPDWPAPVLFLNGPASCGKSHLAAVWQARNDNQAVSIRPKELTLETAESLAKRAPNLIVDGVDPYLGMREAEETLFHLYNIFKEEGRSLLLTGRAAPSHLHFSIPDLASRLRAAPCATIKSPDDTLLQNIVTKMFADRHIDVSEDLVNYLLPRMERSFKFVSDIVAKSDEIAMSRKKPVTIPVVRDALIALQDV